MLNSTELTALHTDTLRSMQTDRTMANVQRRGETLFTEGVYTAIRTNSSEDFDVYHVRKTGTRTFYTVKVSKMAAAPGTFFGSSCPCAFFQANGETCKHLIACEIETAREAALELEYELRQYNDDDRYPEW